MGWLLAWDSVGRKTPPKIWVVNSKGWGEKLWGVGTRTAQSLTAGGLSGNTGGPLAL